MTNATLFPSCLVIAIFSTSGALGRGLPPVGTYLTCNTNCVRGLDGHATNYRICTNNLPGRTVSITQVPSSSRAPCHSFPVKRT